MSFISLLFGNDVKVVQEGKGRPTRGSAAAAAPTSGARRHGAGDELEPRVTMLSTPIELVPVMGVRRSAQPRRPRERSGATTATTAAAAPARHDRLSLWSRLLCRPEVYDPHVEAAPLSHLLDVEDVDEAAAADADADACDVQDGRAGPVAAGHGAEHVRHRHHHASDAANASSPACAEAEPSSAAAAASQRKAGLRTVPGVVVASADEDAESATTVSSCYREVSSEVGDAEELENSAEVPSNDDRGSHTAEPLLHPPIFHVFDTRRCCSGRSPSLSSPTSQSNLSLDAPLPSGASTTTTTHRDGGLPATACAVLHDASAAGRHQRRLISREELTKRRAQRRQQSKEAAKRAREHREAWAALVAAEDATRAGAAEEGADAARARTEPHDGRGVPVIVGDPSAAAPTAASRLTHEALESLRADAPPLQLDLPEALLARLGHSAQLPRQRPADVAAPQRASATTTAAAASPRPPAAGAEVDGEEQDGSESLCSRSSNNSSQSALDDEVINVETGLPVMYGSVLRCRDPSASTATQAKGSRARRGVGASGAGSVRAPAGKYPLGSRAYVERVLFAQRRQQECALFALLTEAHRQAREAHVRLAQLYYYYILPLLAQHQTEEEVCGLERALTQCGTGALRVYHPQFCCTAVYGDGAGGQPRLARVQPVDYQFTEYRFEHEWRELFLQVKAYLGIHVREDASLSTLPTLSESGGRTGGTGGGRGASTAGSAGSVCVAATVLHSLELFERQRHTQNAAKDAEEWLAWYYYYFVPQLQRATSAEERAAMVRSLVPPPTPATSQDGVSITDAAESSTAAASSPSSSGMEPHPLEREYLPLNWSRACNTAEREEVLGYRRGLKLRAIAKAIAAGRGQAGSGSEASTPTIEAARQDFANAEAASESFAGQRTSKAPRTASGGAGTTTTLTADAALDAPDFPQTGREADARWLLEKDFTQDFDDRADLKCGSGNVGGATFNAHSRAADAADLDEEDDDDEDFVAAAAYQTVNAGCFGLSFFSIFD